MLRDSEDPAIIVRKVMGQREIRLNQLVCEEMNKVLHTLFRDVAVNIVFSEVNVSPDMRDAYVYYSVIGDQEVCQKAQKFLNKHARLLREKVFQRVQIKFLPTLHFRYDDSFERGSRVLRILDEL